MIVSHSPVGWASAHAVLPAPAVKQRFLSLLGPKGRKKATCKKRERLPPFAIRSFWLLDFLSTLTKRCHSRAGGNPDEKQRGFVRVP